MCNPGAQSEVQPHLIVNETQRSLIVHKQKHVYTICTLSSTAARLKPANTLPAAPKQIASQKLAHVVAKYNEHINEFT